MRKNGLYLRLSIADGDLGKDNKDESNSIDNQRTLLVNFVQDRDDLSDEYIEYVDDGYSGTNFERPAFKRMIEDAKTGKIDTIIVKDFSRFGRDYIGVGDYLEQVLPILGIRFISLNNNYDSNDYLGKTMGIDMAIHNLVNNLSEIAEILMDLGRKTKLGNTKWTGSTVVNVLRNERHCGDVLSRKTFTPNYLDHKSKKNNHDRNQYRQTDHHEAIVSREIYNAAQKMLDASKYMKKGYPLPTLQVVDQGALKGFVPVNRAWNGFSSADYEKASLSAYSENNNEICAEKTENRGFDLSGYEIVRAQFFSTRFDPAVTISSGKIVFNTACLKKFEDVEYVELLFNSVEKCIAVRPCERSSINAIKWGTIRDGRWAVLPKSCKGFSEPLYELMGWNKDCKYKLRGQFCGTADEQVMIFELEEPEVLVQEKAEEQFAEETEKKPEEIQKPVKKILYPEAWAYNFGESTNRTVFLQRVAYRGNWDILRPARTVEGMEIITREVLDDLLESAEKLIDKMRCANYA